MAALKRKPKSPQNSKDQSESKGVVENSPMNEPEVKAAKKAEEAVSGATAERLDLLLNLISPRFGFDDTFTVRKFDDKGKVISVTLENPDFVVAVTVKDGDQYGLFAE